MEAGDAEAVAEVEGMGILAVGAGVEGEGFAAERASVGNQPLQHYFAVALGAGGGGGDEVIDIESLAADKHGHHAEAGDGEDGIGALKEGEPVAFGVHGADTYDEILRRELGAELMHYGKATVDIGVGGGEANGCFGKNRRLGESGGDQGYHSSRRRRRVMWAV